ncbi:MAG: DDE-type integrase/transposase/recombinase, partial [Verrucomicrobia bacterium]|nr:DDE-type integrase/transposase/recombinase [Verrucomicrobiota bacterium]
SETAKQVLDSLKDIQMKSKGWIRQDDVIDYFMELDNRLIQFENIELVPKLYCQQIINGLTPLLGFRDEIKIEVEQRNVKEVEDLQSLILEVAQKIEREYRPNAVVTSLAKSQGQTQNHTTHYREEKSNKTNYYGTKIKQEESKKRENVEIKSTTTTHAEKRSRLQSKAGKAMKCFNCNGPHSLKECHKAYNQAVIEANKAAFEQSKKRKEETHVAAVTSAGHPEFIPPASIPNTDDVLSSAHVKGTLVDIDKPIVTLLDSGACVSIVSLRWAAELQDAGCLSRRVNKRVRAFDGTVVAINTQLMGIQVLVRCNSGPVKFSIDPFVADIPDDLILDKFTAIAVGLLEIKVPVSERTIGQSEVGCIGCGAVMPVDRIASMSQPFEKEEVYPTKEKQDGTEEALKQTIGPDINQEKMFAVLQKNHAAFEPRFSEQDNGAIGFKIEIKDESKLPRKGPRRLSRHDAQIVEEQVKELLALGIIRPSSSRVSSPVVLVKYEDKSARLCIDYRELNENTVDLRYPTRNLKEVVDRIAGKRYLGKIDLYKGYHQIPMDPDSIQLTAFATAVGLYEYVRLPFGLKNAPAAFQQRMDMIFADLLFRICEIYLDDIIIFGNTEDEFISNVDTVLQRLTDSKLTAKISKCLFGFKELPFLGFLVSEQGYRMDPARIQAIADMQPPSSKKQLRSYLGLTNYFSAFIPDLAQIARPLYELCHASPGFSWTEVEMAAFQALQERIAHVPALEFINYDEQIYLRTDASDTAVGGVLFQEYGGTVHVIQFMSKAFGGSEKNWSTIEKEAYALYYCILHCSHYLSGHHFTLQTDHRNLVYLHRAEVPKLIRWRLRLQEYDFTVEHIPGTSNVVADILSRTCATCSVVRGITAEHKIPEERRKLIAKFHNSTIGHRGVTATLRLLHDAGEEWSLMAKDVAEYIRQCPCCQKNRPFTGPPSQGPNRSLTVYEPFQRLAMDFIGPLPVDADGNAFLLVIVDAFTRWVELFSLPAATAEVTADCILQVIGRYGVPEEILSDNGPQFVADVIKSLMVSLDVNHVFSTPHHHQGNGHVERCNREVLRHLRNIVFDEEVYSNWSRYIPRVQYLLNTTLHSATGYAPIQLLFGSSITVNRAAHGVPFSTSEESDANSYYQAKCRRIETLLEKARDQQSRAETQQLTNQSAETDEFHVHEWVLVNFPTSPPTKLHPKRQGPYRVTKKQHRSYTVENVVTKRSYKVDVERLTRFQVGNNSLEDIERLLSKDLQEYIVESIIDHRRDEKQQWEFLVKWKGYDASSNTWEPFENLKHNVVLKDYLKKRKIKLSSKAVQVPKLMTH